MLGTDWDLLINNLQKKVVPTSLVSEIIFVYENQPSVSLDTSGLDQDTYIMVESMSKLDSSGSRHVELVVKKNVLVEIVDDFVGNLLKDI